MFALILMFAAVAVNASDEKPSGTRKFEEEESMAIIGGSSGQGTLEFNGKEHLFKVSGVTMGSSIGVHKLRVTGAVYRLARVEDFSGMDPEFEAGATFVTGGTGMWLKNDRHVILHLKSENEGVALELGSGGLNISVW